VRRGAGRAEPAGPVAAGRKRARVAGRALDSDAAPAAAPPRARRRAASSAYERIYAVVRRIPRGRVATYGEVAAAAGFPHAPRLAGYALYALPEGSPLPWHRVVGAGGRLSLARLSPDGALTQRMRLEREGVRFDARGRAVLRAASRRRPGSRPPRRG
jgi:methylated-DNA-protein-cysteine methyltransferase-like protein